MGRYLNDYNVMCPFYKGHLKNEIYCEGVTDAGRIVNELPNKTEASDYRLSHCISAWKSCILYSALNTKY